ncbi:MAG: hypothetical protein N3G20_08200 [Verrucomicrobiae bacterium]|nr:hypothetical protein [Verrucomicrobiae bacterium]
MHLTPIKVECYSGWKGDEEPRRLVFSDRLVEIEEIVDRWYQVESKPEWPRATYYRVRGQDQRVYLIKHDLESDEWYLGSR